MDRRALVVGTRASEFEFRDPLDPGRAEDAQMKTYGVICLGMAEAVKDKDAMRFDGNS
jgi:hypothetical protein